MKLKRSMYNIIMGIFSQIITILLGFIIPKLFLIEYGSEVNGLFSSLNQVFAYVALLEAGIGSATVQALYKPIINNDKKDISKILSATKYYYNKVSIYYLICVLFLSFIYPLVIKSTIDNNVITWIILLQGLSGVINFYFQATIKQLLIAEGKTYITYNISLLIHLLTSTIKIILIMCSSHIVVIQLSYFIINIIQMLFYYIYFRKNYKWVNFREKPKYSALNQKNSFLIHQISLLIFSNTDLLVLSIFCDFKIASVYAIYNLVFLSVNNLIVTIYNGIAFSLGHTYHENKEGYLKLHDLCDNYYIAFVFAMVTICYILITPFIELYTRGITDINYIDKYLPILFCTIQLLSSIRMISNNLIRIAGHMKQTVPRTIIEATINLLLSIILVNIIGIYGVLIATIVALLYRSNDIIFYANKILLNRSISKTYKNIIVNIFIFLIIIVLNNRLNLEFYNYYDFVKYGLFSTFIIFPIYFISSSIIDKNSYNILLNIVLKRLKILKIQDIKVK